VSQPTVGGSALIPLPYAPNWENGINLSYTFETAQFVSEQSTEQRRPLQSRERRIMEVDYLLDGTEAQQMMYDLAHGKDKVFGVPIYPETLLVTEIQSQALLSVVNALDYWNLNNYADYIFLFEPVSRLYETVELAGLGDTVIVLEYVLQESFTANKTYVYPLFFGYLTTEPVLEPYTDQLYTVSLTFAEYLDGG